MTHSPTPSSQDDMGKLALDPKALEAAHKAVWGTESLEGKIATVGYSTAQVVAEQAIRAYLAALPRPSTILQSVAEPVAYRWHHVTQPDVWQVSNVPPATDPYIVIEPLFLASPHPAQSRSEGVEERRDSEISIWANELLVAYDKGQDVSAMRNAAAGLRAALQPGATE